MTDTFEGSFRKRNRILNVISVLVVQVLTLGLYFFLSPYLARTVDKTAYGFVSLANNFISYASLVTVALNSMAARFIVIALHQGNEKSANRYFSSTLFANMLISAAFLAVGALFVLNIDKLLDVPAAIVADVQVLFSFVFFSFLISTAASVFSVCYYAVGTIYIYNLRTMESVLLRMAILVILFGFLSSRVLYIGVASFIVTLYLTVWNLHYSRKYLPNLVFKVQNASWSATKELVSSGVWNTINLLGTTLTEGLDLLIGNVFINADAMVLLALAKTVPAALRNMMATLAGVFSAEVFHDYAKEDSKTLVRSMDSSMRTVGCIMNVPITCFIGFGIPFFQLWMPMHEAMALYVLSLFFILETTFSTSVSPVYNVFTAANQLKIPSLTHVFGGILSTAIVLLLLRTTDLGVYAIAGVSGVIGVVKIIGILLPFGSRILHQAGNPLTGYAVKSALSIWGMGAIGVTFVYSVAVDGWMKFFGYGAVYAVLVFLANIMMWFSREERMALFSRVTNRFFSRNQRQL